VVPAQEAPVVSVSGLRKAFVGRGGSGYVAIEDLSLEIARREVVCIVGRTGCGKSTLVNLLLGLDKPSGGDIRVNGLVPSDDFWALRGELAAVFQSDRLLPWRTILENAALGLEATGASREEREAKASEWLDRVGLGEWKDAYPHQLSGGMRQRVAIARAFVVDPEVLLFDEAFGHLDEVTASGLREDCLGLMREYDKTGILITHNIEEALDVADRVVVLARPARVVTVLRLDDRTDMADPVVRSGVKQRIFAAIEANDPVELER